VKAVTINLKNASLYKELVLALTLLSATKSEALCWQLHKSERLHLRVPVQVQEPQSSNSNLKSVWLHAKEDSDNEIEKLRTMAATLRFEAASMKQQ
jgi:hypothetical protein